MRCVPVITYLKSFGESSSGKNGDSLSWRGWLLVTSAGLAAAYFAFLNIHPFLAVTNRVNTNILVVEGSMQRYAICGGAEEFKNGSYERIFTIGGPENGSGGYTNDYNTSASVAAEALKKFGIRDDLVQMVPRAYLPGREHTAQPSLYEIGFVNTTALCIVSTF